MEKLANAALWCVFPAYQALRATGYRIDAGVWRRLIAVELPRVLLFGLLIWLIATGNWIAAAIDVVAIVVFGAMWAALGGVLARQAQAYRASRTDAPPSKD